MSMNIPCSQLMTPDGIILLMRSYTSYYYNENHKLIVKVDELNSNIVLLKEKKIEIQKGKEQSDITIMELGN